MKSQMSQRLQRAQIEINEGEWNRQYDFFIKQMSKWQAQVLRIRWSDKTALIKEIEHISFPNLTKIAVLGNSIDSIEGLGRINMPHIQHLNLNENNIRSIAILRKAVWPDLFLVNITNNLIHDHKSFSQGCFPKLKQIWVYNLWKEDKNRFLDPWFLAKLQTQCLQILCIQKNWFAIYRSIRGTLKRKWQGSKIA